MEQSAHPFLKRIVKSLRVRIFVILFLIGLISGLIVKYAVTAGFMTRAVTERTQEIITHLSDLSVEMMERRDPLDTTDRVVAAKLSLIGEVYDGSVTVYDEDSIPGGDGEGLEMADGDALSLITQCLAEGVSLSGYDASQGMIRVSVPLNESWETVTEEGTTTMTNTRGVLYAVSSTAPIAASLAVLTSRANRIVLIIMLCVLFLAIFLSDILIRPFDRITRAINEVKAGYTDEPISVPDYLETEQITGALNQQQARMKVLDDSRQEFVSNVSHELKTPITSMKVLADTLLAEPDAPVEMYRDFLKDISEEIVREDEIINDLLALVRMDKTATPLNITTVDINELTEIVLKRMRPIARQRNIDLTLESARQITAEIDEVKFSMVVTNLVENAVKYNSDGGWVKVELDADYRYFTMKVSDSGIGMPQEALDQIYERFYRVDKSRARDIGGTGLGLSVARQAVLLHRGEIEAQSTEGVGTIFTVKIPLIYVAPEHAAQAVKNKSWFHRVPRKVN